MEVSAEVHFAQTLASNEKKFRDRALKRLRKYIGVRSNHGEGLGHDDYIKIWKGLHYCMWMQDKPLIQEELSQRMSELLHAFPKLQQALMFVNVFFVTEAREWNGIDRLRLDKFMMLIRGILHETFVLLSREGWPVMECQSFAQHLTASVMNEDNNKIPFGFKSHITEIFLTEMRKVSLKGLNGKKLTILMLPFIYYLVRAKRRELALAVFEKTVQTVLQVFGKWSWQSRNGRKKKKRKEAPAMKTTKADQLSDGEATDSGEESDDEQEDEIGSDEEEEDEDDMDVDEDDEEEEVKKPRFKFDMTKTLKLMLQLAEDPKVESRNRSMIIGIVNSYVARDPNILKRNTESSENMENASEGIDEDDDEGDVDWSMVFQLVGSTEERSKKKKRRRWRRDEEGQEENDKKEMNNNTETKPASAKISSNPKSVKQDNQTKKVAEKKQAQTVKEVTEKQQAQTVKEVTEKQQAQTVKEVTEKQQDQTASKAKSKKRKRASSEGGSITDSCDIKKLKIDCANDGEAVSSPIDSKENVNEKFNLTVSPTKNKKQRNKTSQESGGDNTAANMDTNTNALSAFNSNCKKKTKAVSLSSPVEFTVYPQKSPKHKSSSPTMAVTSASTSPVSVSLPPSALKRRGSNTSLNSDNSLVCEMRRKTPPGQKKSSKVKKSPPEVARSGTGLMGGLYSAISTPCQMVMRAVGMMAPTSDPDVTKSVTTPEQLTPGSQKKVVFDLRKNKANKFKDYLKTLSQDPSPAFEPTKSPSQSILKTPPGSTVTLPEDTPKRKKNKKSPTTASPKLKVPKSNKSLSLTNIRKMSKPLAVLKS